MTEEQRHALWMEGYDCNSKCHNAQMAIMEITNALTLDLESCNGPLALEKAKAAQALIWRLMAGVQTLQANLESAQYGFFNGIPREL